MTGCNATLRRLAVTLGAILVTYVMTAIPLPGLNADSVRDIWGSSHGARPPFSIGGLDVIPLFLAFTLFEAWRTIFGRPNDASIESPAASRVNRNVVILGLLFAGIQAYGFAAALEAIPSGQSGIVIEPGIWFRLTTVATYVASTALIAWLATQVTRFGLANGLWLMVVSQSFNSLAHDVQRWVEQIRVGLPVSRVLQIGLLCVAATTVFAVLDGKRDRSVSHRPLDPWPPVLAAGALSAGVAFNQLLSWNGEFQALAAVMLSSATGTRFYALSFGALAFVIYVLRAVRLRAAGNDAAAGLKAALPAAAASGAICALAAALFDRDGPPLFPGEHLVPLIMVMLALLQRLRTLPIGSRE
jgi:hypothetical protein